MRKISTELRDELADDPYYKKCARLAKFDDHICKPNPMTGQLIEWEHCFIYGHKQINERWSIIPLCWLVHSGGQLDKHKNEYIALLRATSQDLEKYPRRDWAQYLKFLEAKFIHNDFKQ